ncbi:hypothetical protein B0T17DRAFT_530312 [Bombardia bombarda]|uniref:Uncharacterized protein n=1 Tax=Bombardia bombarda TaxID=252184 RepID=A0AA40CB74_9PEZI|nr:hypothetical protein B0T17DRAFT_530312 [Bombardia bombarda]
MSFQGYPTALPTFAPTDANPDAPPDSTASPDQSTTSTTIPTTTPSQDLSSTSTQTSTPSKQSSKTTLQSTTSREPSRSSTATSSTSTTIPSTAPDTPFTFVQLFDKTRHAYYSIHSDQFLSTNFSELCPSGSCITDCQDYPRLFSSIPSGIDESASVYGRLDPVTGKLDVTFFGICSNLGNATLLALAQDPSSAVYAAFLGSNAITAGVAESSANVNNDVVRVASSIATCFASTCEQTRDPNVCRNACSAQQLLGAAEIGSSLDIRGNMGVCVQQLCDNTCGLPYADQDVLGIGVLVSYYLQALLVLLIAAALAASLLMRILRRVDGKPRVHERLRKPLDSFVTAQAFFGGECCPSLVCIDKYMSTMLEVKLNWSIFFMQ